jgi:nitroreductase/ferredoxin
MPEIDNKSKAKKFEELKPMLRPTGVTIGVMKVDAEKCIQCGLCIKNCPFKSWEMDENKVPRLKTDYACFSCYNCTVACPESAISVVQPFTVREGFFDTQFPKHAMPLEPRNAEGERAEWSEVERLIIERRSVRNFKKDAVPEPLIRRVLEAGRFGPSAGNQQPWKFTVVTDREFLGQLEAACQTVWTGTYQAIMDDEAVMDLVNVLPPGIFDPRITDGMECVVRKELPVFFGAPVAIFVGANDKMADPSMHAGIAMENMNLAALSLGLGFCWSGFGTGVNFIPELKSKLGFDDPWRIQMTAGMGYPEFKQRGPVARHLRPVTWFRSNGRAEVEE